MHCVLVKHAATARSICPSLATRRISQHVLRHTTVMGQLQQGVEQSVIALWLKQESIETTKIYIEANLVMKEVLARMSPPSATPGRYKPGDTLLAFLKGL